MIEKLSKKERAKKLCLKFTERVIKNWITSLAGTVILVGSIYMVSTDKIEPVDLTYIAPIAVLLYTMKDPVKYDALPDHIKD